MTKLPVVYIISDSVGETAEFVVRAAASQFDGGQFELRRVSHVYETSVIDETVDSARTEQGIIAFTLVLPELREYLLQKSDSAGVRAVDIMGPMMDAFEDAVGEPPRRKAGLVHQLYPGPSLGGRITIPQPGGIGLRDRGERAASGRHYAGFVRHAGVGLNSERSKSEDLQADRGVASATAGG